MSTRRSTGPRTSNLQSSAISVQVIDLKRKFDDDFFINVKKSPFRAALRAVPSHFSTKLSTETVGE
jgi:hypothetical protein